jgi:hypothetical protein
MRHGGRGRAATSSAQRGAEVPDFERPLHGQDWTFDLRPARHLWREGRDRAAKNGRVWNFTADQAFIVWPLVTSNPTETASDDTFRANFRNTFGGER